MVRNVVKPGINDLETYCKKNNIEYILKEWDYSNNNGMLPSEITYGSQQMINWICEKKHPFPQKVYARTSQLQRCPYCTGKKVWPGDNDLMTKYPQLAKEWSPNNKISPSQVNPGTNDSYEWICSKCGHIWFAKVSNRTRNKSGCPACAGQVVVKGKNDLASQFPQIAAEWDWTKNTKSPDEYTAKCRKPAYWICPVCGYGYQKLIQSRTVQNQGCQKCARRLQTSFPEQAVFFYVKRSFPDAESGCKTALDSKHELDIYIPSKKIGIEYDGARWHKSSLVNDEKKYEACKQAGIFLIRIREASLQEEKSIADKTIISNYNQGKKLENLDTALRELFQFLKIKQDIDFVKDDIEIQEQYKKLKKNSAGALFPELIKEWYQEENGAITLFMLSPSDKTKYSWKCSKCGKIWKTSVGHRTRGENCRDCGYKIVGEKISKHRIKKNGSLDERFPEIAKEWDYTNNEGVFPSEVAANSNRERWWICPKGHPSYPARVADRTQKKTGCPRCAPNHSRKVLCVETGVIYDSIRQAKLSTGYTNIYQCVHGEQKTAGGFHWKFVENND